MKDEWATVCKAHESIHYDANWEAKFPCLGIRRRFLVCSSVRRASYRRECVWPPRLVLYTKTSLVLRFTIYLHRIIEQARAAHPIPNSEVKCRLAKLELRLVVNTLKLLLSQHCTQGSCPYAISLYGEIRDVHLS